jgi:hypothetical protein
MFIKNMLSVKYENIILKKYKTNYASITREFKESVFRESHLVGRSEPNTESRMDGELIQTAVQFYLRDCWREILHAVQLEENFLLRQIRTFPFDLDAYAF